LLLGIFIAEIGTYAAMLGKKTVVLWGATIKKTVGEAVLASLKAAGVEYTDVHFNGECTKEEANRVAEIAKNGHECVIGIGGGKVIDTAKAVAIFAKLPHIIVPTVASNDSPTSACAVWYDSEGVCVGFDLWPANPDYILVDTEIIAQAHLRYLQAGIGDAMATWFEAEASYASRAVTCSGGVPTMTAMAMAKLCYEILKEFGLQAIEDVKVHAVTPALEKVVEASVLFSGIGWESGGLATAHVLGNGLPVCFADLNMDKISAERLKEWAKNNTGEGSFVHNHNFKVSAGDLYDAMLAADALGKRIKASLGK
jgi:glycerol dehydrogenase